MSVIYTPRKPDLDARMLLFPGVMLAALMVLFGLGAGLPLMILGALSRTSLGRLRGSLAAVGRATKLALGGLFVLLGVFILTGFDRTVETAVLSISPEWLTALTTSL